MIRIIDAAKNAGLSVVGHLPMMMTLAEASDAGQRSIEHNFFTKVEKMSEEERRQLNGMPKITSFYGIAKIRMSHYNPCVFCKIEFTT